MDDEYKNARGETEAEFLRKYDVSKYFRPSVTADIAVFTLVPGVAENSCYPALLLIKRSNHPDIFKWALPGGFVEKDETVEYAAARELREETSITDAKLIQFHTFSDVNRDKRTRVITVAFLSFVPYESLNFKAGDDAASAALFRVALEPISFTRRDEIYRLKLIGQNEILTSRVKRHCDYGVFTTEFFEQGDFASDHSQIIFAAICELKRLGSRTLQKLIKSSDIHASKTYSFDSIYRLLSINRNAKLWRYYE